MAVNPSYVLVAPTVDRSGEATRLQANQPAALDISAGLPTILTGFLTAFAPYTELVAANLKSVSSNALYRQNQGLRYGVGHREVKWKLHFTDNVTGVAYEATVPLATNLDAIAEGTDFLPNANWAGTSIETTAEALFYSADGNLGTLVAIELVRGSK